MVAILVQLYGVRRVSKFEAVAICLIFACALTIPAHATIFIVATSVTIARARRVRRSWMQRWRDDSRQGISGVITLTPGELLVDTG